MANQRLNMGRVIDFIINACFPRFCVNCGAEGALACLNCTANFNDHLSVQSAEQLATFAYGNKLVRDLIKAWKYDFDQTAWLALQALAAQSRGEDISFFQSAETKVLVPIPLSRRRELERGFNQSAQIASWLAESFGLSVMSLLERSERAGHQATRSDEERALAMSNNPFSLCQGLVLPEEVILVDDVWTTGSTMQAAAKALMSGGVKKVSFYSLAKGR